MFPPRPRSPITQLVPSIYAPNLMWSMGIGALSPVLVLTALALGFSQSSASLIAGLTGLVGVLTGPWIGHAINQASDKAAFSVGTALAVAASAGTLVALAHPQQPASKITFIAAIVALALSTNIWSLARQAYVAESLPPSWRARGMSMMGGMIRLGALLGPAVGSLALLWWGLPGAFWLQMATAVLGFAMVIAFVLPSTEVLHAGAQLKSGHTETAVERPRRERADVKATAYLALGTIVLTLVRTNRNVVIPLWGNALGISDHVISATFAASALLDTLMFYPSGRIMDSRGRRWALIPTLAVMGVGFVLMALWTSPLGFITCACLIGFGNGFGAGILMTMGADLSPDVNRSSFLGVWQSVTLIGSTVGPFLCAAMVTAFGVRSSAWATGVLSLLGMVWFALLVPVAYRRLGVDERGRPLGIV